MIVTITAVLEAGEEAKDAKFVAILKGLMHECGEGDGHRWFRVTGKMDSENLPALVQTFSN